MRILGEKAVSKKPSIKLKHCPCCGDTPHWRGRKEERFLHEWTTRTEEWGVHCGGCGMSSQWSDSAHFAAEKWNYRQDNAP